MTATAPLQPGPGSTAERPVPRRPRLRGPRVRPGRTNPLTAAAFLGPWLTGLVLLTLGPMLASLYLSFTRYDVLSSPEWVGLDNFVRMFTADPRFWSSVGVTLGYVGLSVPLVLAFSLLLAVVLERGIRFLAGYRVLFYLPTLLGTSVAVAVLWRQVFGEDGIFNLALALVGIEHGSWVGDPATAIYTIVVLNVWAFGSTMVIFLGGLRQIPRELTEAAAVDGAGPLRRFCHVKLPMLTPLVFFNLLLTTVHAFQAFTSAYIISNGTGGPSDSTLFYTLYLYEQGFGQLQMGYASAMAWVLVIALAAFTGLLFWTSRYWVHYGDQR
ncbi:sugar ABC transporter permease [Streptomonospora sediminis]